MTAERVEPNRPRGEGTREVVITGIGVIAGPGVGIVAFREGLRRETSPVSPVSRFDPSSFRSQLAVEVSGFEPRDFMDRRRARRLDRFGHLSIAAARQALEDAELDATELPGERVAVQIGSALGGIAHAEQETTQYLAGGIRTVDPRLALTVFCGASSCNIAIEFGFQGPNSTNAMSCASGTMAIGEAFRLVRGGVSDFALAGGVEAPLAPLTFGAFSVIRAMSTRNDEPERAYRPFDRERDGFIMGEGAAVLLLEEETHARRRGARVYARLRGYGTTSDAHHMVAPRPDASQAARAMTNALADAAVDPSEVDYVNAHGSSTPLNDPVETLAIRAALGDRAERIAVSSTKPYYGHALGASGAIEAAVSALVLREAWIPPTLNLEERGEGCDLDYVPLRGRELQARVVMSNSFGFGGINASLVLTGADEG